MLLQPTLKHELARQVMGRAHIDVCLSSIVER